MQRLFIISFCLLAAIISNPTPRAHADTAELRVICGGVYDLCGLADENGTFVLPQQYQSIDIFSDGLAAARYDGLWGYLDRTDNFAIEPRFDHPNRFYNGRAEVVLNGRAGVIDRSGSYIVPPAFVRAIPFGQDAALIRETGNPGSILSQVAHTNLSGEFRLYHRARGILTSSPMEFEWFVNPGHAGPIDLIWASPDGQTFGLLTNQGGWLVDPQFSHVQGLHEDRAVVVSDHEQRDQRRWGAVDANGRIVIPLEHHWLSYFENGYGLVGAPGRHGEREIGLIAPDGTIVSGRLYDEAQGPGGGRPARVQDNGIWYVFTEEGEPTREEPDETLIAYCPQGLHIRRDGPGYSVTNAAGERTLEERFSHVNFGILENGSINLGSMHRREIDCNAPIAFGRGPLAQREWIYLKPDGVPLLPDIWFTSSNRFIDGFVIVKTEDRAHLDNPPLWGILDRNGTFTLPLGPDRLYTAQGMSMPNGEPMFVRTVGEDYNIIDVRGEPADFQDAGQQPERQRAVQCPGGSRIIGNGEVFGIEDLDGQTLVPSIHRAISCFENGLAWAPVGSSGHWCPIGPSGTFTQRPACIDSYYPYRPSHHGPERFADDAFESNILWVRAYIRWGLGLREEPPLWIRY